MHNLFFELTLVFVLAGMLAFIVNLLKQPAILSYILTGLILGPYGYVKLQQGDSLESLAEIGITLLLFMVGLELDLSQLGRIGKTAFLAGLGQIILTAAAGFAILKMLGFATVPSVYIATALTFSSTIIVVKLLGEKRDLHSLYGRLAVGIFLVQDFVAILIMIGLSTFSGHTTSLFSGLPLGLLAIITVTKLLVLGFIIYAHSVFVFPKILRFIGKNDELLLIFSLAWALGFASLLSLPAIGFGLEIGGFLAGLALAKTASHFEIGARIKSLRDFFIIIFFIVLGSQLVFGNIGQLSTAVITLSLFVLIGNPLIVLILLGLLGYKPRTGFLTGVTVAQISEFSFILMGLAMKTGHVSGSDVSLVAMVGVITIALSSYMIKYANTLYEWLKRPLSLFNFGQGKAEIGLKTSNLKNHTVLVGANRLGSHLLPKLAESGEQFVVVDFNPEVAHALMDRDMPVICGDISDSHIQELARLDTARLIISTVPDIHDNLSVIETVRHTNPRAKIIVAAQDEAEARLLYEASADYAVLPHFIGGVHLSELLADKQIFESLRRLRGEHLETLGVR